MSDKQSSLNPTVKEIAQLLVWAVAVAVGGFGIYSGISESGAVNLTSRKGINIE